jgi:hypothetical protein
MKFYIKHNSFFSFFLLASSFIFYGCSSVKSPVTEIAQAEQIVNTAQRGRAPQYAPSEFQLAQEKLKEARVEIGRRNYEKARRLSEQSRADAEFAIALAEAEYASEQARKTQKGIQEPIFIP